MKKILLFAIAIMLLTPVKANAFSWGDFFRNLFGISSTKSTEGNTSIKEEIETTLKNNLTKAVEIDKDVQGAFLSMVTIISGEQGAKTIKNNITQANKKSDDIERLSALNQIYNDYSTVLNNNKVEIIAFMALLTDKEKETLTKNINTILEAADKYVELGKENINLASTVIKKATVNDDRTTLLLNINKTTNILTECAKSATSLSRQAKILAKVAGIKF